MVKKIAAFFDVDHTIPARASGTLDLLERVGHQVVVNPGPLLLKREAVKRGWPIINFKPLNPEG